MGTGLRPRVASKSESEHSANRWRKPVVEVLGRFLLPMPQPARQARWLRHRERSWWKLGPRLTPVVGSKRRL